MFKQTIAITAMNLRAIPQRLGTSSVIVVGIARVVAVPVSVLAMATGFPKTVANSGRADRALVPRGGLKAEIHRTLARGWVPPVWARMRGWAFHIQKKARGARP